MKQTGTCPKCQGRHVMHLQAIADAGEWFGSGTGDLSARGSKNSVARQVLLRRHVYTGVFGETREAYDATGEVEAYVCADCGYFEEYLKAPSQIRWQEIAHATPWSPPHGQSGPYR